MKNILISLSLIVASLNCFGQHRIEVHGQSVFKLQVYRGIISISQGSGNNITISQKLYDYDLYRQDGQIEDLPISEVAELKVTKTSDSILLKNMKSRHLQVLEIQLPRDLYSIFSINHFGEIKISDLQNPVECEIFQGEIKGIVRNSFNASIIRDGDIDIAFDGGQLSTLALSVYSGDISLSIDENSNYQFQIYTQLGEVLNQMGLELNQTTSDNFYLNGEPRTATWYSGSFGSKPFNNISISNTHGKILIQKI